VTMN